MKVKLSHTKGVETGIHIQRLPSNGRQKLTPKFVKRGESAGWLTKTDSHIIIHDNELGDISFKILAVPGRVCSECGDKLPDDGSGRLAQKHIDEKHKGKGRYECPNYYDTQVEG